MLGRTASSDAIIGNGGNDILSGLTGNETLTGGTGADVFLFTDTTSTDTVTDYSGVAADGDIIDVTSLFVTAAGASNAGDFLDYNPTTGVLSVDANGSTRGASFVSIATLTGAPLASTVMLRVGDINGASRVITANLI